MTVTPGGAVLVLNVWGSWCEPCRQEAPILKQISEASAASGVRFVGIDIRDTDPAARAFWDVPCAAAPSIEQPLFRRIGRTHEK